MKQKELESYLSGLDTFSKPKILLEQYQTSPHIAAQILTVADSQFDSIQSKSVLDLGCGPGIFTAGSLLLDAGHVMAVDIDQDALDICHQNLAELFEDEKLNYDLLMADCSDDQSFELFRKRFDTVLMNPPFGTKKNAGLDMVFMRRAIDCATESVYSLHKTSTREFIMRKCRDWNVHGEVIAELRFDLPQVYKCHKKSSVNIEVDLIRIDLTKKLTQ